MSDEEVKTGLDEEGKKRLRSFVERIEYLEEEKKKVQSDIKEVYDEAKSANFDIKALREIIKLRKQDENERREEDFVLSAYKEAFNL
ncbi:MAG: DUF2312 domain-containing protein [Alphaproteobacteria bacterium]|nr:DUF2312 domain-containing protein [Alphaproteobacteria bacterium]